MAAPNDGVINLKIIPVQQKATVAFIAANVQQNSDLHSTHPPASLEAVCAAILHHALITSHHTVLSAELENLAAAGGSNLPTSGGGGGGGESYEDLCKAHIDAFMHAAAAAEVQTELASRCACDI